LHAFGERFADGFDFCVDDLFDFRVDRFGRFFAVLLTGVSGTGTGQESTATFVFEIDPAE
jgi:hypothetical protein